MMQPRPSPGLLAVALREFDWLRHDIVSVGLVLVIPLLAIALLSFTFSNAVVRDLSVDVVDQDQTRTSLTYVQAINAAPGVAVTRRSSDLNGAMHAVRSGKALGAVYIPRGLERDIEAGKRPQIVIFYNKQYFTPGNIASGALSSAVSAATADLPPSGGKTGYAPGALVVEQYVLTNPALNYAQFLLRAILPMVLHVIVAITGGYAVGSEFGRRNFGEWMRAAGGDPLTAVVGKLAP
jgi:ABC-2 type transport system permease protein